MRRIYTKDGDIFRPGSQAQKEFEMAAKVPGQVIEILGPRLSAQRRKKIDEVVARRTRRLAVAVEGVHDPHNTAAIIRTADAFGIQDVHIIEGATGFRSSRKVTQGSHKWVDLSVWSTAEHFVEAMRTQGRIVLSAFMEGSQDIRSMKVECPIVLVFGNEAEGISDTMKDLSDGAFRVPMFGFVESLNVSVAAAVSIATLRAGGEGELTETESKTLKAAFYLRAIRAGYDIVKRG